MIQNSLAIAEAVKTNVLQDIRLVATDMDGTLTQDGKFTTLLLQSLEKLAKNQIDVVIVTGRSAGWVEGIAHYLPIMGAIAENGGLFYTGDRQEILVAIEDFKSHREQLAQMFQLLQSKFPQIQESADNRFRLTDWTFDLTGLTTSQLQQMNSLCQANGWGFTYSTVQCHIKLPQQNKASSLQQVLKQHCADLTLKQVVTVGDSPNDESLFDLARFPLSVGVANVLDYSQQLQHQPVYVTSKYEAEGFDELVELILKQKI